MGDDYETYVLVGCNVELLVLGAFEVLGSELHQEGAPVEPLLRGDPMEPVSSNSRPVRYAPSEWVDLIRQRDGDEICATRGRGGGRGRESTAR